MKRPVFTTELGSLYQADCSEILEQTEDESVDLVFADPPFNLGRDYGGGINDSLADTEYLNWCDGWITQCVRTLKSGGALFLWKLPRRTV